MYKGDSNLMTSDLNNDKKFIFLSQENIVDYREKPINPYFNGSKADHPVCKPNKSPWVKEEPKEDKKFICDIVKRQELPMASYVSINDQESRNSNDVDPDLIIPQDKEEVRLGRKNKQLLC